MEESRLGKYPSEWIVKLRDELRNGCDGGLKDSGLTLTRQQDRNKQYVIGKGSFMGTLGKPKPIHDHRICFPRNGIILPRYGGSAAF